MYKPEYSKSHALIIGIDKYQFASPLACARSDAEGVANILIERFGFQREDVILLKDEAATSQGIRRAFLGFANDVTVSPDDRILLFFAGHGHTVAGRRGEIGFLVPVDGNPDDLSTLIRWDDLTKNAELISAKHVLFLMDACYGGLALKRRPAPSGSMRLLVDMLQRYSRQVLASGKADEVVSDADGGRAGHSIFTSHLIDALEGAAATEDGVISANRVMAYVYDHVGSDQRSSQTPHYGFIDGDGDFIFQFPSEGEPDEKAKDILIPTFADAGAFLPANDFEDTLKEWIGDPNKKIQLDGFVSDHVRRTRDALTRLKIDMLVPPTSESFVEFIKNCNDAVEDLIPAVILIARWGDTSQMPLLEKVFARLAEMDKPESGVTTWIGAAWYPIMKLMYVAGISALSAARYDVLRLVFKISVRGGQHNNRSNELISIVTDGADRSDQAFKLLPGHERNLVPRSEYIFQSIQGDLEDALLLGKSYESYFDLFEMLWTLVYADIKEDGWGPSGRFVWKQRGQNQPPFDAMVKEAKAQGSEWPPLRAGLFGGSLEKFSKNAAVFRELMVKYPLR